MLTTVRLLDLTGLQYGKDMTAQCESLTKFLLSMETLLREYAQHVSGHYLSRVPATPHYGMISGERQG